MSLSHLVGDFGGSLKRGNKSLVSGWRDWLGRGLANGVGRWLVWREWLSLVYKWWSLGVQVALLLFLVAFVQRFHIQVVKLFQLRVLIYHKGPSGPCFAYDFPLIEHDRDASSTLGK